tara:strand:- start:576 stop:1211 length:636 start_codon:yes stop_codon:yes gene_type:complete
VDTKGTRQKKKIRVGTLAYGDKYDSWWQDNFKYMIDKYSNIEYDEFVIVKDIDPLFEEDESNFMNQLTIYKHFKEENYINLFMDIDVIIKGDCNKFLTEELHVCDGRQWQSDVAYNNHPAVSDIASWSGDVSHIYQQFVDNIDMNYLKYPDGIDAYLSKEHNPKRYTEGYTSIRTLADYSKYDVVLFNGHADTMLKRGWWHEYTMEPKPWW